MAGKITYLWKLTTRSASTPFRIKGHRLSAGFWIRFTKDVVNEPPKDEDDLSENRYVYDPLPDGKHIRLLELHPGSGDDPLSGTLRSVSLADSAYGRFDALSYVWGDMHRPGAATIALGSGQNLRIAPNLTDALRQLRHSKRSRVIWVDAICINQQDDAERAQQVPFMAEIYTHCHSVLVWLGLPTPHTRLGMEILAFLAHSSSSIGAGDDAPWAREQNDVVEAAINDVLGRPYFSRLWVVQEAALAPRVVMHVGRAKLEWDRGAATRRFLMRIKMAELAPSWQTSALRDAVDFRPVRELLEQSLAAEARRTGTPEPTTLLDVVHSIRNRNVMDPRDRIYGVMSLVTPAEVAGLVPDYSVSWEETYRRFYDLVESRVLRDPGTTLEDVKGVGG
ncbi:heterokaryon incompatibility protein-domain-containing protein [Annulohypoxylon truncatum]|uniref:heterokaryon incompatibility protein-domain-containing protein n=1 Tax=Annulohypoxylon truncatum TaxID=327061 RepID=UPI002007B2A5|nr:heterokaryon incompatibility protein-domain-containing protein [Annulohypoxylon truncatum]KAI1211005.1 heterokaryon incompatibility protein-domain-containing protein [Annulohypoxylon truncatum]